MTYSVKSFEKTGKIHLKNFSGGVNLREQPGAVEDNQCSKIKNMWFKDGALQNRPAININPENKLYDVDTSHAFWCDSKIFGSDISPENRFSRLAILSEYYDSFIRYNFFLVDKEGGSKQVSGLAFYRTSADMFSVPHVNGVFYEESKTGSGIFVMITFYNYDSANSNERVAFYELSEDYSYWLDVTEERLYVPTIYINGRGNNYGAAFTDSQWEKPKFVEGLNMLTGQFKAFYTTDDFSNTFVLPLNNLDNEEVVCRAVLGGEEFLWRVLPNMTASNAVRVFNEEVTMFVDRTAGNVAFYNGERTFSLPFYNVNNLEIRAYKKEKAFFEALKASNTFCEYSSRIFLGGFLEDANAVYFSEQSNPFYFPRENILHLGSKVQKVTALCVFGKMLIAFKDNKTYSIYLKKGAEYNIENVISNTEDMPNSVKPSVDVLSEEMGCDCVKTILNCGNHLVWLSSSGKICTIVVSNQYSKGNIYELSMNIETFLKGMDEFDLQNAVAALKNGYYVVFIGNKAVAMDYTVKGFRYVASVSDQSKTNRNIYWYLWEFPEKFRVLSAFSFFDDCVLIASQMSDDTFWYGTAKLQGNEDCVVTGNYENLKVSSSPVECFLKTKSFDFGETGINKFVKKAYLSIKNGSLVSAILYDGEIPKDTKSFTLSEDGITTKELCFLNSRCRDVALSISTTGETKICSLQIEAVIPSV